MKLLSDGKKSGEYEVWRSYCSLSLSFFSQFKSLVKLFHCRKNLSWYRNSIYQLLISKIFLHVVKQIHLFQLILLSVLKILLTLIFFNDSSRMHKTWGKIKSLNINLYLPLKISLNIAIFNICLCKHFF